MELFSDDWSSGEVLHDRSSNASALLRKQKKIDRSIAIAAGGFAVSALVALLIGVIYQIILVKGDVIPGLVLVWLILATALIGGLASYRRFVRKALSAAQDDHIAVPARPAAEILSELPPMTWGPETVIPQGGVASVTERTTGLLGVQRNEVARSTGEGF